MVTMKTIAEYDAEKRQEASDAGHPIERMALPSVPLVAAKLPSITALWLRGGKLFAIDAKMSDIGLVAAVDEYTPSSERLCGLLSGDAPLFFADRGAWRACLKSASRNQTRRPAAETAMTMASALPSSARCVRLDEALRRKFWAPTDCDANDIGEWRKMLGVGKGPQALIDMIQLCLGDNGLLTINKEFANMMAAVRSGEGAATSTTAWRSTGGAVSSFRAIDRATEAWRAVEHCDPYLKHRFVHDGTVARFVPLERSGGAVVGSVSQPFRLREGNISVLSDTAAEEWEVGSRGKARIVQCSFDPAANALMVHLDVAVGSNGRRSSSDFQIVDNALNRGRSILLTNEPFLMSGRSRPTWRSTWTQPPAVAPPAREVPLDVLLAGGPVEA